jgi:hypothetical protein
MTYPTRLHLPAAGPVRIQVRDYNGVVYIWVSGAPRAVLNAVDQLVRIYPPIRIGPLRRERWRPWRRHIHIDARPPERI